MTVAINGVVTTNAFPPANTGGCQIPPVPLGFQTDIVVGNAAAAVRLYTPDPALGARGGVQVTDEFIIVAGVGQIVQASYRGANGFEARSFIAGSPATVYATVWEKGDPVPLGGSSYAGNLTASGSNTVALTNFSVPLTSPVNLTGANVYTNIINASLGAGTWLITAQAYFLNGAGVACGATARLWDNSTNVYRQTEPGDSGSNPIPSGSRNMLGPLTAIIVLGSSTVISLSVASTQASGTVLTAVLDNSNGNLATSMDIVQIG